MVKRYFVSFFRNKKAALARGRAAKTPLKYHSQYIIFSIKTQHIQIHKKSKIIHRKIFSSANTHCLNIKRNTPFSQKRSWRVLLTFYPFLYVFCRLNGQGRGHDKKQDNRHTSSEYQIRSPRHPAQLPPRMPPYCFFAFRQKSRGVRKCADRKEFQELVIIFHKVQQRISSPQSKVSPSQ